MRRPFVGAVLGMIVFLAGPGWGSAQAVKIRIIADEGHVRLLPNPQSSLLKAVPKGAVFPADDIENEWYRVFLPGGRGEYDLIGFIHRDEAEKVETASLRPEEGPAVPEPSRRPLSLKISGGTARCRTGFPNTVREYLGAYFRAEAAAAKNLVVLQGDIPPVHNGYSAAADLLVEFGRLGLGLGAEYIRVDGAGSMNFATKHWTPDLYSFSMTDRLTVVPVRANVYADVLRSRFGRILVYGGAGLYFGHFSDVWNGVNEKGETLYFSQRADASALGFQAGLEIEIRLSERLSLVAEAAGRRAVIDGFTGTAEGTPGWFHPKSGISETPRSGILYSYELQMTTDGPWIPELLIFDAPPTAKSLGLSSRQRLRGAAEARLDFTGYSARLGLRFKF